MRIDKFPLAQSRWFVWLEAALLLVATPFLIFPTFNRIVSIAVAVAFIFLWMAQRFLFKLPLLPVTPMRLPIMILVVMACVGVIVSADLDLSYPKMAGIWLGFCWWRFSAHHIRRKVDLFWLGMVFLFMSFGFTLIGLFSTTWLFEVKFVQAIFKFLPPQLIKLPETSDVGISMNQLAGTLLYFVPLLIVLGIDRGTKKRWQQLLFLLLSAVLVGLLVLTQSRSAWLGFLVGIVFIVFSEAVVLPPSLSKRIAQIGIVVIFLGAFIGIQYLVISGKLEAIIQEPPRETAVGTLSTIQFRFEVWTWGIAAAQDFLFTGTGLGSFRNVVHRLYPIAIPVSYDISHAHNIFLQTMLDVGLFGLISYLAILLLSWRICWQLARHSAEYRPFALGLLACLVSFHAFSLTDAIALGAKPGLLLWLVFALITAMHQIRSAEKWVEKSADSPPIPA